MGRQDQREHEAFNAKVLAAQPRRSWTDCGTQRFSIGALHARQLRAYLADAANRDERGRLLLHDERETALKGYSTYKATLAVEAGETHSEYLQARHTILLSSDVIARARSAISSLDILADGAQRQLPKLPDGGECELLHGHILDQRSCHAGFSNHQDTEEELARGKRKRDRRVVYTVIILLSDDIDTSMRVVGQEELKFTREAGSGMVFPSELWHRTERPGGWKLTLFFGYFG